MELLLTSARSLFALVLIVGWSLDWKGALALFVLFVGQLVGAVWRVRILRSPIAYVVVAIGLLMVDGARQADCCGYRPKSVALSGAGGRRARRRGSRFRWKPQLAGT